MWGRNRCLVSAFAIQPLKGERRHRPALLSFKLQAELDWIAPMMPVIYPEDCQPGTWQMDHPACNRSLVWRDEVPPPAVGNPSQRNSFCIQVGRGFGKVSTLSCWPAFCRCCAFSVLLLRCCCSRCSAAQAFRATFLSHHGAAAGQGGPCAAQLHHHLC